MFRLFVSLLILLSSFGAFGEEKCVKEKIRVITNKEAKISRVEFCYESGTGNFWSKSCGNKDCKAYKVPKKYYISEFLSPYGSPGFGLCRELGGIPEIVEFYAEKSWNRSDRCNFPDGFVDTDTLLAFYIDRP